MYSSHRTPENEATFRWQTRPNMYKCLNCSSLNKLLTATISISLADDIKYVCRLLARPYELSHTKQILEFKIYPTRVTSHDLRRHWQLQRWNHKTLFVGHSTGMQIQNRTFHQRKGQNGAPYSARVFVVLPQICFCNLTS